MSTLSFTVNYGLKILAEPGYYQLVTARDLAETGFPSDQASHQGIWADEPSKTVMLRPLQLDPSWLNSQQQLDSVIRLSQMVTNPSDVSGLQVYEAQVNANCDGPWIYHQAIGPSAAFIRGVAPVLAGIALGGIVGGIAAVEALVQHPTSVYTQDMSIPGSPPSPTKIGDVTNGKLICATPQQAANQGLYFRWFFPRSDLGWPCVYTLLVGQYLLRLTGSGVEVFRDISAAGDRTSWKKELVAPLWAPGDKGSNSLGATVSPTVPHETGPHDRSLLWLPYRRNQVLLLANTGRWVILQVNGQPQRLADGSDWNIVRSDVVAVWAMTPAFGRFQIQQLKYPSGTIKCQFQHITLDYTPSGSPTVTLTADTDHGSTLTAAQTNPPGYTIPTNSNNDCPPTTTTSKDVRQNYGVELSFQASSDHRWTPYFYALEFVRPRTLGANPATPTTISDSASGGGSHVTAARISIGEKPGEGRATVDTADIWNGSAYPLAVVSGQSGEPVQLVYSGNVLFTGIAEPTEVVPLRLEGNAPRRIVWPASDLWKLLVRTNLRDQRDWTGNGHIDVVSFIAQQAGIDTSGAEFPAGYTPNVIGGWNTPLGDFITLAQKTKEIAQGWKPHDADTAASFIERIAKLFSGWRVGFRANGTFFYLPRDYFTTPAVTFGMTRASGTPRMYGNPTFETVEPEANVILVRCADAQTGTLRYSSLWVDWASILNPAVPNYLGYEKREVVEIGGTFNCAQLNQIARTIWRWTRRRIYRVKFEADWVVGLEVGHVATVGNQGNWWITSVEVTAKPGNLYRAHYTAEYVESGSGNANL